MGGTGRARGEGTDVDQVGGHVGGRIRKRRTELGWSLRDLEERADVNNAVILRIETGAIAQPRLDKLNRLARALGLNLAELLIGANAIDLPPYRAYLEARYPSLSDGAVDRLEQHFDKVIRETAATVRKPAKKRTATSTSGRRTNPS
jgi:transcriptional regulator with XRE-family HTH domain